MPSSALQKNKQRRKSPRQLSKLNIHRIEHLAKHMGCSIPELRKWASTPEQHYYKRTLNTGKKPRPICCPRSPRLKSALTRLNDLLQRMRLDPAMHGGRRSRSPLTNARPHVRRQIVIKEDIKDFFPSCSRKQVEAAFIRQAGCSPDIARILAAICTPHNQLPQGSPHSSMVAALVLNRIVRRLRHLALKHGGAMTQYVDDTTISGPSHMAGLVTLIRKIIESEGFSVHPDKQQILGREKDQEVTGLRVNDRLDASRELHSTLRHKIVWMRVRKPTLQEVQSVEGQLAYLGQVNPGAAKLMRRRLIRNLKKHGIDLI